MSKLALAHRLLPNYVRQTLFDIVSAIETQLNQLTEGRIYAKHAASTAAPVVGTWAIGDKIDNSAPSVLGSAGSQYVIIGFVCVASGTPGTWVEMRTLTGT